MRSSHHGVGLRVEGPWPFITLRSYMRGERHFIWRARQSRKGLDEEHEGSSRAVPLWQTATYNWITGAFFAVGSMLFMLGAVLSLLPPDWSFVPSAFVINVIFFSGSLPFTTAGYLQHFQAANAPKFSSNPAVEQHRRKKVSLLGWHPKSAGWISTFAQFIGTIAFNFNTFDAIHAPTGWASQDLTIWVPGMIGSILFLVSGYLAFIETCHAYWAWRPRELDWWIVFVNLLGCVFFMTASTLAYVPMGQEPGWIAKVANLHLALGALGFLIGAVLMMIESRQAMTTDASERNGTQ